MRRPRQLPGVEPGNDLGHEVAEVPVVLDVQVEEGSFTPGSRLRINRGRGVVVVEFLQRRADQPLGRGQAEGVGQQEMILDKHLAGGDAHVPVLQDGGLGDAVLARKPLGAQSRVVGDANDLQRGDPRGEGLQRPPPGLAVAGGQDRRGLGVSELDESVSSFTQHDTAVEDGQCSHLLAVGPFVPTQLPRGSVQAGETARGPGDEPSGVGALAQRHTIDGDVVPAVADNADEQLGGRGTHARAVGECVHEDVEPAVSGQGLVQVDLVREGDHSGQTDETGVLRWFHLGAPVLLVLHGADDQLARSQRRPEPVAQVGLRAVNEHGDAWLRSAVVPVTQSLKDRLQDSC